MTGVAVAAVRCGHRRRGGEGAESWARRAHGVTERENRDVVAPTVVN
ncbi:hypothetical protein YT1_2694 [Rhodococcus ruber]|nr:hypothetical protein YT1_2694 [Rhodococcus ruber]